MLMNEYMNEQIKENLSNSVSDILSQHDKQSSWYEVKSLINRWYSAKMTLINKLSKHPNWNEDALAIILSTDEKREIDSSQVYRTISDMMIYANNQNIDIDADTKSCIQDLQYYPYQFIDVDMKYSLQQKNIKSNEGQKVSRLLNSLFTKIGLDKLPEYNKLYAKIADAYNPLTIKRTSILSVHPCDFLHMSYGTGWKSCHNIDDGCYMAGTLSYMCDEVSLIFYTIDNEYSGNEYFKQRKITRNVFCYYDTMLLQSRLYPNNDEGKKTQYREIVQSIFSICDSIPNLWIKKPYDDLHNYYITHCNSLHYPDYEYQTYNANISLQKDFQLLDKMTIGSTCYCLDCGEEITEHDYLYCDDCTDDKYVCDNCGCRINVDDAICIDGYYYCSDCVSYCESCHEYTRGSIEYVNGLHVCEYCLSEYYFECADCGEYIEKDSEDYYYIDGENKHVCCNCYDKYYFCCEECGDYCSNYDENEYNGMTVCNCCYESLSENDIEVEDEDEDDIEVDDIAV